MSDNKQYIQDTSNNVYKVLPSHYLKLSPWEDGEDRRVHESDINGYKYISYKNACMIVNTQFSNKAERWNHKGKKYLASPIPEGKSPEEHAYILSTLPNHKTIIKKANSLMKELPDNNSISIISEDQETEFKMVKHKGKVYYMLLTEKTFPRVKLYDIFGDFCLWCGVTDCKPIFCETDKKYI